MSATEEQVAQVECLVKATALMMDICLREISEGRGRMYSVPMMRAAIDEVEKKFMASPEYRGTDAFHEKN